MAAGRRDWTSLTDAQLLAQCAVDTYRASGPGGQKRNKTSSAVRLRHGPTGLLVIAEESRSQHENRARALRRLREALYLKLREGVVPEELAALRESVADGEGRIRLGRKDPRFWPAVGVALDVLHSAGGRVAEAAATLGISTGNLIDLLQTHEKVWEQANQLRGRFGHKALH
jgi:hypothetical protein